MDNASRRSIRRRNPNAVKYPTFAAFAGYLFSNKIEHGTSGRPIGARVMVAQGAVGPFLTATFAHPTKRSTRGRLATLTWRKPRKKQ